MPRIVYFFIGFSVLLTIMDAAEVIYLKHIGKRQNKKLSLSCIWRVASNLLVATAMDVFAYFVIPLPEASLFLITSGVLLYSCFQFQKCEKYMRSK